MKRVISAKSRLPLCSKKPESPNGFVLQQTLLALSVIAICSSLLFGYAGILSGLENKRNQFLEEEIREKVLEVSEPEDAL